MFHRWFYRKSVERGAKLWEECVMTPKTTGSTPPDNPTPHQQAMPKVNKVTSDDITASLKAGFSDFLARPVIVRRQSFSESMSVFITEALVRFLFEFRRQRLGAATGVF